MFCTKIFFFNIFCYFNPNHAYWNQRRLFSGNLPGMFIRFEDVKYEVSFLITNFVGVSCKEMPHVKKGRSAEQKSKSEKEFRMRFLSMLCSESQNSRC